MSRGVNVPIFARLGDERTCGEVVSRGDRLHPGRGSGEEREGGKEYEQSRIESIERCMYDM